MHPLAAKQPREIAAPQAENPDALRGISYVRRYIMQCCPVVAMGNIQEC
jgi:hypothetical protein